MSSKLVISVVVLGTIVGATSFAIHAKTRDGSASSAEVADPGSSPVDTSIAKPTDFLPRFGTRDARTCKSLNSKPTVAQIPTLLQCAMENHNSNDFISLYEDITMETGSMRPYNYNRDHHYSGIDTTSQLLPIRGTMTAIGCSAIWDGNKGKNCSYTVMPTAEGDCYKTAFGDWKCHVEDFHSQPMKQQLPPPPHP